MTAPLGRLLTAMVTPMTPSGDVDLEATKRLAKALIASGTEGIVSTGSTGEAATLSEEETVAVWVATKEAVGPDIAVIAGATNNDTRRSIRLAREAERTGMDGVLMTVPAYSKPPQAGLIRHFTAIAEATSLPGILYNIPGRAALNMPTQTVVALADVPNIVGIKEASGDLNQIGAIIDATSAHGDSFRVWSGNDSDTLALMALGGYGVVSVASHLVGRQIASMIAASLAGRNAEAAAIHHRLMPLVDVLFIESNPIPVKYAVNLTGIAVGDCRLPLIEPSESAATLLRAELARHTIDLKAAVGV
ncbi:MAG: 4-hydroxy-tetrahydrodipicolinate synthase [Chloroflexi bacterium]|nr:4-hydroxy-tetrahydrodipicolinate synthase [Chloroflexota bacterium]